MPPRALPPCEAHPDKSINCGICRSDALVAPGGARKFDAMVQAALCDTWFPPRYAAACVDHPEVAAWVDQWHADPGQCPSLLLIGNVGTGKTWQAFAALRAAVTGPHPRRWTATTAADMYAALRPDAVGIDEYRAVPLLLLDDLGAAKTSDFVEETTYRIIGGRYDAMLPTIYTTNVAPGNLKGVLGARIADRLVETCVRVDMIGASRRRKPGAS